MPHAWVQMFATGPTGRTAGMVIVKEWPSTQGCNPCMMEATIVHFYSVSEPHISSLKAQSKELYTIIHWRHSQIARSDTCAIWLTWILWICFTCRLFDSMLEVIIAAIYTNLMSVYSGCLNYCNWSCAALCISGVSRDKIIKNILEICAAVQQTVETIRI